MILGGWTLVGIGALCFAVGARDIFYTEVLRAEAGDILLWRTRRVWDWLRKARLASHLIRLEKEKFEREKLKKKGKVDYFENLRREANHIGIEATAWFATSAFFASVGGILINLGDSG